MEEKDITLNAYCALHNVDRRTHQLMNRIALHKARQLGLSEPTYSTVFPHGYWKRLHREAQRRKGGAGMSEARYKVSMRTFSIVLLDTHRPIGKQQVMASGWTKSDYKNKELVKEYCDECDRLNAEHRKEQPMATSEQREQEQNATCISCYFFTPHDNGEAVGLCQLGWGTYCRLTLVSQEACGLYRERGQE